MYILAFDIGTSGIKTSLVSDKGKITDAASYEYPIISNASGWAEQDPETWWKGACVTANLLHDRNALLWKDIAVIGVCGHMLGCIPVDSKGVPLAPAILHADTRSGCETEEIAKTIGRENLYHRTGSILSEQVSLSKIMWIKNQKPEIYAKTARFLQSKDYLVSKMTGNIDITDFSDASHAQLIDIHSKKYLNDVFQELSLDGSKFPAIYKGTDVVGKVTKQAAESLNLQEGIPVIAGGGDGACASIGSGVTTAKGEVYCCIGTTAWLAYQSKTPVIDSKSRIFDIMSLDGESFGIFGTMQSAGKSIDWACELLGIENGVQFDIEAQRAPEGSQSLIFLPYLDGERSPVFDAKARGMFFRIDAEHRKEHFARSVLEGVSFALRSILEVFRETKPISDIRVIGGGANSSLWMQILSDICHTGIYGTDAYSSSITSLGVALAAAVGIGAYKNLDEASAEITVSRKNGYREEFRPLYDDLFDQYMKLYPLVKPLF